MPWETLKRKGWCVIPKRKGWISVVDTAQTRPGVLAQNQQTGGQLLDADCVSLVGGEPTGLAVRVQGWIIQGCISQAASANLTALTFAFSH